MDKTAIRNFAIWARRKMRDDVMNGLGKIGITESEIKKPTAASTSDIRYFDMGYADPIYITKDKFYKRDRIVRWFEGRTETTKYEDAYKNLVETTASAWFNRIIALRFMEVNEYLTDDVRMLSSREAGKKDPDIVTNPYDSDLEFTDTERDEIRNLKLEKKTDELFALLLAKRCKKLSEVLPGLFVEDDYTDILVNFSVTDPEGLISHLINDISEDDWKDQVQIIGWMYQYYNAELKDETFALLKKNQKISKERIASATQLFTPDWIVRYMVENSLGRLWYEGHKDENVKANWKYYVDEAEQSPEVEAQLAEKREQYAKLTPEDLTFIDPSMGSGHVLVYAFEILMQIYESVGYTERDAAQAILKNNIYGLDIDDRAYQLAFFAVMMKARQYDRRILERGIKPHVFAIQESNDINLMHINFLGNTLPKEECKSGVNEIRRLISDFRDAKIYGSIIRVEGYDFEQLRNVLKATKVDAQSSIETMGIYDTLEQLNRLIDIAEVMQRKYYATATNPPYMGGAGMNDKLNQFLKDNYTDYKSDLFSAFIIRCFEYTKREGRLGFLTPYVWMFIQSYEKLRNNIVNSRTIESLIQFEYSAFEEATVPICSFSLKNTVENKQGVYFRLTDFKGGMEVQRQKVVEALNDHNCGFYFESSAGNYKKIAGEPIAYWVGEKTFDAFEKEKIADDYTVRNGISTGDNEKYLRLWQEVNFNDKKWAFCNKGGSYRKWYGNNQYVVFWENDGHEIKTTLDDKGRIKARLGGVEYSFREGIEMSRITSGKLSFRYSMGNFVYESSTNDVFDTKEKGNMYSLLGYLNSNVVAHFLNLMNPTINIMPEDVRKLPLPDLNLIDASLVEHCINISREDWDSFEESWDFKGHPFVIEREKGNLKDIFEDWENICNVRFNQLREYEEKLNMQVMDIFNLHQSLKVQEEESDISVKKADLTRDIKSFISFFVGCMFGRYSVDTEGLVYAGGDWDTSKYTSFFPDVDNVVPITDTKYFDDDIVESFCKWLTIVYGEESLDENLKFIADALGGKGDSSKDVIRNYFLNDFFKDHCSTYSVTGSGKRPIYWLFDSGKQNGFKALIYMHRYDENTLARVRTMYLHKVLEKYENEVRSIETVLQTMSDERMKAREEKRREKLLKQIAEVKEYDEKLEHLAAEKISIDLDDGVKVNYEKIQTDRFGKVYPILAKIK